MKKTILLCSMFLAFLVVNSSGAAILEVGGSYMTIAMTKYNDSMEKVMKDFEALGGKTDYSLLNSAGAAHVCWVSPFSTDMGLYGITLVTDYIVINTKNKELWPDGKDLMVTEEDWSADYIGLGLRRYFVDKIEGGKWSPFVGVDLGVGYTIGNFQDVKVYYSSGSQWDTGYADMSGVFFGCRAEVGFDYWFNDFIGLYLKTGGRYMKGELKGTFKSAGIVLPKEDNVKQEVDYSGFVISTGLSFQFDWGNENKKIVENSREMSSVVSSDSMPELPQENNEYQEYTKKGNIEFERKRYKIALTYYEQAAAIAETAEVYKKIGNSNYYLGNKKEAKKAFEKSLELNPEDVKLKEWLKSYK